MHSTWSYTHGTLLFQAWQLADFGKDEAAGVIHWAKFGREGSILYSGRQFFGILCTSHWLQCHLSWTSDITCRGYKF